MIRRHLGDCPIDVLKDTVDEVLMVLKNEHINDKQRREEVNSLMALEKISGDDFASLTVLA